MEMMRWNNNFLPLQMDLEDSNLSYILKNM